MTLFCEIVFQNQNTDLPTSCHCRWYAETLDVFSAQFAVFRHFFTHVTDDNNQHHAYATNLIF